MKKVLLVVGMLVAGVSVNAQTFKAKKSMIDGVMITSYTLASEVLNNSVSLIANVIGEDTTYYLSYRNLEYTRIYSYSHTNSFTKQEFTQFIEACKLVQSKEMDMVSMNDVAVSRSLGSLRFTGRLGWNWLMVDRLENHFNQFIGLVPAN